MTRRVGVARRGPRGPAGRQAPSTDSEARGAGLRTQRREARGAGPRRPPQDSDKCMNSHIMTKLERKGRKL